MDVLGNVVVSIKNELNICFYYIVTAFDSLALELISGKMKLICFIKSENKSFTITPIMYF